MASVKISALDASPALAGSDILPVVDDTDTTTKKCTVDQMKDYIAPTQGVVDLVYSGTVDLNFAVASIDLLSLDVGANASVGFTTSSRTAGSELKLLLIASASDVDLTFPAEWNWINQPAVPSFLRNGEQAFVTLTSYGTTDGYIQARFEPTMNVQTGATPTQNIRFDDLSSPFMMVDVDGYLEFTGSGMQKSLSRTIHMTGVGGPWGLTFPAAWVWPGSTMPSQIADGEIGILSVTAFSTAESGVIAVYVTTV